MVSFTRPLFPCLRERRVDLPATSGRPCEALGNSFGRSVSPWNECKAQGYNMIWQKVIFKPARPQLVPLNHLIMCSGASNGEEIQGDLASFLWHLRRVAMSGVTLMEQERHCSKSQIKASPWAHSIDADLCNGQLTKLTKPAKSLKKEKK